MCIPIIFTCGTMAQQKVLGQSMQCPRCGAKAPLIEASSRYHFCFLPLCKTGDVARSYKCGHCGSVYPAA